MDRKKCKKCDIEKDISLFALKNGVPREMCKECLKSYMREHYLSHKKSYFKQSDDSLNKRKEWLREYKSKLSCSKCGESHIACLDFHHLDPSQKEGNISDALKYSLTRMIKEINKCIVLCSNCHRKLHFEEKQV